MHFSHCTIEFSINSLSSKKYADYSLKFKKNYQVKASLKKTNYAHIDSKTQQPKDGSFEWFSEPDYDN